MKKILPPAALAVIVLAGWQIYVAVSGISEQVLPSPVEVARAFVDDAGRSGPPPGRRCRRSSPATRSPPRSAACSRSD